MSQKILSFQTKLFFAFALVTLLASTLPGFFSSRTLYEDRLDQAVKQAHDQAYIFAAIMESAPSEIQIKHILKSADELSLRVTITDAYGTVQLDSSFGGRTMPGLDNHSDRPEIEAAAQFGQGTSVRRSNSLEMDLVYAAQRLDDGRIIRVALPLAEVKNSHRLETSSLSLTILWVALFCLLLSVFLASRIKKSLAEMTDVVESISLGNYHSRLREVPGKELVPLADAVNRMAENIEKQIETTTSQHIQLNTILNSLHEGVLVLDHSGLIFRYNRALGKLFPTITEKSIGKQLIESIMLPALQTQVDNLLLNQDEHNADPDRVSLDFELPSGQFIITHISRPVTENSFLGAVIVFYNATRLVQLERVRSDFISNVSHELRTPLTAIASSAEILMGMENIDDDYRHFPAVIHRHATALSRMVSDLLALARLENDDEQLTFTEVNPQAALLEALNFCDSGLTAKDCRVEIHIPETVNLRANSFLLTQVFRNLLENACRYSPRSQTITVNGRIDEGAMLFTVADKGDGIPADDIERIFERFYQVDKNRSNTSSGIGLSLCRHIVEKHGGRIWAESPYMGKGTAVMFTIPLFNSSPDKT